MTIHTLYRPILSIALAVAAVAPALATSDLPRLLPIPVYPSAYQPTAIHIYAPDRSAKPIVLVRQVSPQSRPINVTGSTLGGDVVLLPPLEAGAYDVEYYDLPQVSNSDQPRLTMRFFVSENGPVNIIEFFNNMLGHYFITGDLAEIRKLDEATSGWERTGESFRALPPNEIPSFASPVCRYYGLPSAGIDSHFFSASADECARVAENWPDAWVLETPAAFGAIVNHHPYTCEDTMQRLYRLYNNRPDANHRYTASTKIRDAMLAKGWVLEAAPLDGPYDTWYSMCVPR